MHLIVSMNGCTTVHSSVNQRIMGLMGLTARTQFVLHVESADGGMMRERFVWFPVEESERMDGR